MNCTTTQNKVTFTSGQIEMHGTPAVIVGKIQNIFLTSSEQRDEKIRR